LKLESELKEAKREYEIQVDQCTAWSQKMATILLPPRPKYVR
jgi:hypothetical protein